MIDKRKHGTGSRMKHAGGITLRAVALGVFFSALFAVLTVYAENTRSLYLTATQIPVLPYLLLILMVLLLNPICRLTRIIRSFASSELMIIFIMGLVSSSLSTFGLTSQLIPIAGSLFTPEWNTRQSEWNRYVVPFVNNEYFLSAPGREIQERAKEYHRSLDEALRLKQVYETARRHAVSQALALELEKNLEETNTSGGAKTAKTDRSLGMLKIEIENARIASAKAKEEWLTLRSDVDLPPIATVIETYPKLMETAMLQAENAEASLLEAESEAFKHVTLFRRSLPNELSAYPGLFALPQDDSRSYFGRIRRLTHGKAAVAALKRGSALAEKAGKGTISRETTDEITRLFDAATGRLAPLGATAAFESERSLLRERSELLARERLSLNADLSAKSDERRSASRAAALTMDREIKDMRSSLHKLAKREKKLSLAHERNERELACAINIRSLVEDIESLKSDLVGGKIDAHDFARGAEALLPRFVSADISLRRFFIGEVPWRQWARPLGKWALLIGLTYLILMSLNVLIFRQWAHNEKLTYPLAELPKALIGGPEAMGGMPAIFGNGLFWAGFAIAATVMGWNMFCATQIVPGLQPFDLNNRWYEYVNNTQFQALRGTRSMIFFTMIGLSFLIPRNISFSLWFFHVGYMLMLLFMVWGGYGQDERSFSADWLYLLNFRFAIGQGAIMVFSSIVLYKCRHYILCGFSPSLVSSLATDEQKELKSSSLAFVLGSTALILVLWRDMGANLFHVVFAYLIIILVTIGLVRAVAEGGLLSFQAWSNPFHFIRAFFGLDKTWTCASLFTPLLIYYSILFMDIKAFIAPAMANAIKLRDDFGMKRGTFHLAVFLAIIVAAVTAVAAALILSYSGGADSMNVWFYTAFPRSTFDGLRNMIKDAPGPAESHAWWIAGGATVMGALLYLRQLVFWLPHPLGLVMFVNPIMGAYWFSILLGWLCNTAVTKYGNKNTHQRATGFFIGLIVGELLVVMLSIILSIVLEQHIRIDLNRN